MTIERTGYEEVMEREWEIYGHTDSTLSLRYPLPICTTCAIVHSTRSINKHYTKTKPSVVKIAERTRPDPGGRPGYIRVDTVHQGDLNETKGVPYQCVDEVTQWEIVASVEKDIGKPSGVHIGKHAGKLSFCH